MLFVHPAGIRWNSLKMKSVCIVQTAERQYLILGKITDAVNGVRHRQHIEEIFAANF
jgi:hypothetical protein